MLFDIETETGNRSNDLELVGSGRYFSDPSTRVTFVFWKRLLDDEVQVDDDPAGQRFKDSLRVDDILVAHNAVFDLMGLDFSPAWPGLFVCTAAACRASSVRGRLKLACQDLNSVHQKKDMPDYLIDSIKGSSPLFSAEMSAEARAEMIEYGKMDVWSLEELFCRVAARVPEGEIRTIDAHLRVNMRGLPFDKGMLRTALDGIEAETQAADMEFLERSGGFKASQSRALAHYIMERYQDRYHRRLDWDKDKDGGYKSGKADFDKIYGEVDDHCQKLIDLRRIVAKNTGPKIRRVLERLDVAEGDRSRLRDAFMYAHAITGRWGSGGTGEGEAGANMQNNERGGVIKDAVTAPPGFSLYVGDFSQIELRIALWLTNEDAALTALHDGLDFYKHTAAEVFNKKYEDIDKATRFFGKCLVLGANYGMGANAFRLYIEKQNRELAITPERAKELIDDYRKVRSGLSSSWHSLDMAVRRALTTPGARVEPAGVREVWFQKDEASGELLARLPTGRFIRYPDAELRMMENNFGPAAKAVPTIVYMDTRFPQLRRRYLSHGGKILENLCQAISRDLLCRSLVRFERFFDGEEEGVIAHVHDEIVARVRQDRDKQELDDLMLPPEFRRPEGLKGLKLDLESHMVSAWGDAK